MIFLGKNLQEPSQNSRRGAEEGDRREKDENYEANAYFLARGVHLVSCVAVPLRPRCDEGYGIAA